MTFKATPLSALRDPTEAQLGKRLVMPLSRFNDADIRCGDHERWQGLTDRFSWNLDERERVDCLVTDLTLRGLRRPVEIWWRDPSSSLFYVSDGHHRLAALRLLGCTHVPYRWFVFDPTSFAESDAKKWQLGRIPAPRSIRQRGI